MKKIFAVLLSIVFALSFVSCSGSNNIPAATAESSVTPGTNNNPDNSKANSLKKPSEAGALQILEKDGKMVICDKSGNPIQLRGMSTHGLQWFPEILNDNAFVALSDDWGSNVIRLAMYVGEDGYASFPDEIKKRVITGIDLAIAKDMYVIVDWHVLTPGDPNAEIYSGAMDFFKEISSLYPNNANIIYELCNEPCPSEPGVTNNEAGWKKVKAYAEPIIKMLRDSGNQNLILVGSPNWSQRPDLASLDPINDKNTAYTVHFYTGTHEPATDGSDRSNVMSNTILALENGVAVFASEWGTSEASGNNGPYLDEADVWLDFLDSNNISWCNWSLTNKNETSAAFIPFEAGQTEATNLDPGDDKVWDIKELSLSGEYVRSRIKGIEYNPIERPKIEVPKPEHDPIGTTAFPNDFEDGTRQGWNWDGVSGVKNSLTIKNAGNSKALNWEVTYPDVKPSDNWASAPRLILRDINTQRDDNQKLCFDFYLDPVRATKGHLSINLAFAPPMLGYWAQCTKTYDIELSTLGQLTKTDDNLYHFEISFDLNDLIRNKVLEADTLLRDIIIVVADVESDYSGQMYLDNIRFEK